MTYYVANSVAMSKSPLNESPTKQAFSFTKTGRFTEYIPECKSNFYACKEGVSYSKKKSMGYGSRHQFALPSTIAYKAKQYHHHFIMLLNHISTLKNVVMFIPLQGYAHLKM